ncbi:ABC transporter ATP-binding protein [Ferrimonas sp. SCSIO 43195]|uniref:ABC transporter ATP-binding protein n=1 Tax=Ferrimonas sp. SCSIO 43195 TaxID=2822844 RepID=UPI002074D5C7|nr:ABC transporter ATP-binding protein [Ferrimonas sp. SCSIO 43195]USD36016.1 ABC transporter ATP-binding protein [Ferrimonas sp. SCSIO 43195]
MIKISGLSKRYAMGDSTVDALNDVNLSIDEGEFVAIMGPSGSGKSTLMNLIGCLDQPSDGHYLLAGQPVNQQDDAVLSQIRNERIGFVFQSFHLLPRMTALDNVMLPLRYRRSAGDAQADVERARQLLTRVGLGDRLNHRPNQLSGGQRQRVAIARALINQPAILLADEPTGALDSRTSDDILALFKELNAQGQTVVLVTHEEEVARHARRIVWMRDGRIEKLEGCANDAA